MLVLRRRVGEAIQLGDGIEIEVIEISRTRVKLGITAPRDVPVTRKETMALAAENKQAGDLVESLGADGVGDLLRLLNNLSPQSSKTAAETVDK